MGDEERGVVDWEVFAIKRSTEGIAEPSIARKCRM